MKTVAVLLSPLLSLSLLAQETKEPPKPVEPPKVEAPKAQDAKGQPDKAPADEAQSPKTLQLGTRVDGGTVLVDIDGVPQRASELMGKLVVVNFWSTQCPIQRDWNRRLADIQKEFEAKGVVFLHVDSNVTEIGEEPPKVEEGEKPCANIREHLAKNDLPFRVLVDHGNKIADFFDARTTPHVYVFGRDGRLVYKGLVDDDQKDKNPEGRQNYLRDVVGKLIAGETVEPFSTKEHGCTIKRTGEQKKGGRGAGAGRGQ
jgi:thiol-disulfide isomerase/thioredoxin